MKNKIQDTPTVAASGDDRDVEMLCVKLVAK